MLRAGPIGGINQRGKPYANTFLPNGTVTAKAQDAQYPSQNVTDQGKWQLNTDVVCFKMEGIMAGPERCWRMTTDGSAYRYVTTAGNPIGFAYPGGKVPLQGGGTWQ